jgi:hypothetical protein
MKLKKAAAMLALATLAGASSAFATPPDERALWEMLQASAAKRTHGMAAMAGSTAAMSADKERKGRLSAEEVAKILDPNVANP